MYIMGLNESIIKTITEPVNHLLDNCGRSDCHTKCFDCFELDIAAHSNDSRGSCATTIIQN